MVSAREKALSGILTFDSAAQWESWLEASWQSPDGVWLRIPKKASGVAGLTIEDALDVALCYGWIDGTRRRLDETFFLQRYSPRRPRSSWSQVNVAKVEALLAAGRMRPPGLAEVEAARADGRWAAAYVSQRNATVPPDLAAALDADEHARAVFESLGRSERYGVILPLLKARTPEQRLERLHDAVTGLGARGPAENDVRNEGPRLDSSAQ
jgi:uncharacterized protein YdeI (YjbR/CyaY-like superfamily)